MFFVAVGKDALFLHDELKLNCTCIIFKTCTVGFPVKSAEKYISKIKKGPTNLEDTTKGDLNRIVLNMIVRIKCRTIYVMIGGKN